MRDSDRPQMTEDQMIEFFHKLHREKVFEGGSNPVGLGVTTSKHDGSGPNTVHERTLPGRGQCQFFDRAGSGCGSGTNPSNIFAITLPTDWGTEMLVVREAISDDGLKALQDRCEQTVRNYWII